MNTSCLHLCKYTVIDKYTSILVRITTRVLYIYCKKRKLHVEGGCSYTHKFSLSEEREESAQECGEANLWGWKRKLEHDTIKLDILEKAYGNIYIAYG